MNVLDSVKSLETKQKIMLVVVIILMGAAVYMGYATFFPSSANTAASVAKVPVSPPAAAKVAPATGGTNTPEAEAKNTAETPALQNMEKPKNAAPTPEQLAILAQSQQLQEEYVHLVNEYQVAQLQQKLAETDAEIAKQKLSAVQSIMEVQKIEGSLTTALPLHGVNTTLVTKAPAPMTVMFVGRKNSDRWSAILGSEGNTMEVRVGTRLPDGSVVTEINAQGVVLTKDGKKTYLPIPRTLD